MPRTQSKTKPQETLIEKVKATFTAIDALTGGDEAAEIAMFKRFRKELNEFKRETKKIEAGKHRTGRRGRPVEAYSVRRYARHFERSSMTEWRERQVSNVTPEARAILEAAGLGKQKYFVMLGQMATEDQVEYANAIVRHFGKEIRGNKIVRAFLEATGHKRKEFYDWFRNVGFQMANFHPSQDGE
ncbi:MAG: hypothetical protein PSV22_11930 [Pseudolabrys sp.]|nr:hypothetical protein [Pseudolabrys sp.]